MLYQRIIEKKGITAYELERILGLSNGAVNKAIRRGSAVKYETMVSLANHYPDLGLDWMVSNATGEGLPAVPKQMAKDLQYLLEPHTKKPSSKVVEGVSESMVNYEGKGTPVYNISFAMGLAGNSFMDIQEAPIAFLNIPAAKGCDAFTTAAHGQSMMQYIYPGDWVGFKRILRFDEFIEYGEPYGIVTDEFELIKYIRKGRDKKHFLLVSENEDFEDVEVPLKMINGLYHVKAVLPFSPLRNNIRRRRFSETA